MLVAKAYSCDTFTREQKIACQGTCNECIDETEEEESYDGPPLPATEVEEEATRDDFVKTDNYVDDYNDVAPDGVLPDHGQGQVPYMVHPGYVPGMVHPGLYPGMYPGMYPAGMRPAVPAAVPPANPAVPPNPNIPAFAAPDGTKRNGSDHNPDGAIRGGKSNINVPVLAAKVPGALLPLWSVVLIIIGTIVVLLCCCWCSIKCHGMYLTRQHNNASRRQQKESEMTIARLNTEINAMKAIAKEQAENEQSKLPATIADQPTRGQTNLATYPAYGYNMIDEI